MELRFDTEFVGMNCTITQTGGPLVYTVKTPTTRLPMISTFARNDATGEYAKIEWHGFSARLIYPSLGLDVDLNDWLHKYKWYSPSRAFNTTSKEQPGEEWHWLDSAWLPDWIFKHKLKLTPASDEKHVVTQIGWGPLKEPIMTVEQDGLDALSLDIIVLTGVVMLYYKKDQEHSNGQGASRLLCGCA